MYFSIVLKGLVEHNLPYDGPKSRTWTKTLKKIEIKKSLREWRDFRFMDEVRSGFSRLITLRSKVEDEKIARQHHNVSVLISPRL